MSRCFRNAEREGDRLQHLVDGVGLSKHSWRFWNVLNARVVEVTDEIIRALCFVSSTLCASSWDFEALWKVEAPASAWWSSCFVQGLNGGNYQVTSTVDSLQSRTRAGLQPVLFEVRSASISLICVEMWSATVFWVVNSARCHAQKGLQSCSARCGIARLVIGFPEIRGPGWSVVVGGGKGRGIEMVNRKGEMVARQSPSRKAKPGEALISLDLTWTTIRVDLSSWGWEVSMNLLSTSSIQSKHSAGLAQRVMFITFLRI